MMRAMLTHRHSGASPSVMDKRNGMAIGLALSACMGLSGCITLKAPEKPIEINLNINIKQEVVVSLKKDAEDFIANNPDLFPQ